MQFKYFYFNQNTKQLNKNIRKKRLERKRNFKK